MATKTWRLVVTELGGSAPLSDVTVEATNWMAAVKTGRTAIGEEGGVPTGASCAVAPDGKVTIHDPVARKSYVLTPGARVDKAASPAPATQSPEAAPPAAVATPAAPKKKVSKKTIAYNIHEQGPIAKPQEVAIGAPAEAAPVAAPAPVAPAATPAPAAAPAAPTPAAPEPVAAASAQASQPSAQAPGAAQKKRLSKQTIAYNIHEQGPIPKPQAVQVGGAAQSPAPSGAEPALELLAERSEDPSEKSPLHYREKIFVIAPGTAAELAEDLVRAEFGMLRAQLDDKPPGKFFNLAVFDHRWQQRPNGPPIVTLQWKDWRGDPAIAHPARELATPASTSAPAVSTPAPAVSTPAPAVSTPAPAVSTPAPAVSTPAPAVSTPAPAVSAPAPAVSAPAPAVSAPAPRQKRTKTDEQDIRLAKAFEASQDLFFLSTPVEGLEFAMRLLSELVPCEAASACLYDINTDEFRFVALSGPGAEVRQGEAVPNNTGLMGAAARRTGHATIIEDATTDARFDPGVDGRVGIEPKSFLYMPLNHQNQLYGIVQLINRKNRPAFTTADGDVTAYVGKQLAEFLQQARISVDKLRRQSSRG